MYGVYINDSEYPFTEWILGIYKTVETRNKPTLRPLVGQRVGIIRTGNGKPMLVGYATISEEIEYTTRMKWNHDYKNHLVPSESKYDFTGCKYGYRLTNVSRCFATPLKSLNGNRSYRVL